MHPELIIESIKISEEYEIFKEYTYPQGIKEVFMG
jgi:hypothetical protein